MLLRLRSGSGQRPNRARRSSSSPLGSSPSSVATPRAICSSCSRSGRSCSITTKSFSSSVGICTTGARMITNVRFCLPAVICRASAWTISAEFRNRWKLTQHQQRPSRPARPRRPATGWRPADRCRWRRWLADWPAIRSPWSMSQVASRQFSWRQSWAISASASSCSCDSIHMPVKHAARIRKGDRRAAWHCLSTGLLGICDPRCGEFMGTIYWLPTQRKPRIVDYRPWQHRHGRLAALFAACRSGTQPSRYAKKSTTS